MSPTPDSTLDDPQQTIADLQRQLAESNAERDETQAQQAATAEVLQVINSSPGDLAPVFDALLEKATRLCEAPFGTLLTWDGERFHFGAVHGEPRFRDWVRHRGPIRPDRDASPLGRILAGERVVSFADWRDEGYRVSSRTREMTEASGIRSAIWVALHKDDVLLGTITVYRQEVRPFTDKQIALLQNFAAQAVIAMENARLITETREALEQQTATAEVLQVINSSPGDLAPVFDAILEKAHILCGAPQGGMFLHEGGLFRAVATRGMPEQFAERLRQGIGSDAPVPGPLMAGERFVHIRDMAELDHPMARMAVEVGAARSLLAVPLRKADALFGVIVAGRREVRPYSDKQIALLQNFAAQAVIAIENARLITETREALEQQTATAEVLGVINSSPGDLAPVFDAILEKAIRLCDADSGLFSSIDGELFTVAAIRGESRLTEWLRHRGPVRPAPETTMGKILRGENIIQVVDAKDDDAYRRGDPTRRMLVDVGGYRSSLSIALRKEGRLLGAFSIGRKQVRPFTDKQVALLQSFGAQAAIAIENAHLLGELRQRTDEVGELNRDLEARVAEQVEELGRVGRLKRFLAPQLAELIVSQGDEKILESHRREIVVVFCDLRGYTAFTETAEPEEVLDFLRQYHGALGPLVSQFEGTLDQFSGDGIMVFFNDPIPCPDPAERAVKMAVAMREVAGTLIAAWRRRGRMLGFGAGIAQGYATLGQIGFADRSGYTAIGTVCNLAARLCAEAKDGQILIAQLVAVAVEETTPLEEVGELTLKGLTQPVVAYNVPLQAAQPALRVIEGGPQSV
jgi:class 3 adenylate cyclase